jgi:hypothetical protein
VRRRPRSVVDPAATGLIHGAPVLLQCSCAPQGALVVADLGRWRQRGRARRRARLGWRSINHGLTVTFDWRRLLWPPPLI